ncbi:MAG TPA: hypothetical protein DCE42_22045 [Myxococcales bacterium]|nr:hypothetical protein [Myxococcales bacterium]
MYVTSPQQLPIDKHKVSLLDAFQRDQRMVIVAPTGSGKSTRLPLWLSESTKEGKVLIVEPRRIACRALAEFLASQRGEKVGQSIGYRVRFDTAVSAETEIEFVTPGVALRMIRGKSLEQYNAFLIDEFHERSWELDLLVVLLLRALETRDVPLVLTSATIAGHALADTLGATLFEVEGRTYPVQISYEDEPSEPTSRDLEERILAALKRACARQDEGDILVFLPGKREIEQCRQLITKAGFHKSFSLLPVHAGLPMNQLSKAFAPTHDKRRIYLSTNVAETSLTLPGVRCVIDSGLARMRIHRGGRSALALVPIPMSLMDQRAGRAGRVAAGDCIRCWKESYRARPHVSPEIERVELEDMLLLAADNGLYGEAFEQAPWLTPPPSFAKDEALQLLTGMGALDEEHKITDFGASLMRWPVSTKDARLLVGAPDSLVGVLADLVAVLQQHSDWLLPLYDLSEQKREDVKAARVALLKDCKHEVSLMLTLLRRGTQAHHLHQSGLRQTRAIASQLRRFLGIQPEPTKDKTPLPDDKELAMWLLKAAPELGFILRERARRPASKKQRNRRSTAQPWANGQDELMVEPFVSLDEDAKPSKATAGIILSQSWIGTRGLKISGRGRLLLPCKEAWFVEAGLGEVELLEPFAERRGGGYVIKAKVKQTIAGTSLEEEEVILRGQMLREAVASLVMSGKIMSEVCETLLDTLFIADLCARWPDPKEWRGCERATEAYSQPAVFLSERLEALGVEEAEELSLLEVEDYLPDLWEWLGIDDMTLASFAEDFPRIWTFRGLTYRCDVNPPARRVTMEPVDKKSRKAADPDPSLIPRFRGFRVLYRCASRQLTLRR